MESVYALTRKQDFTHISNRAWGIIREKEATDLLAHLKDNPECKFKEVLV